MMQDYNINQGPVKFTTLVDAPHPPDYQSPNHLGQTMQYPSNYQFVPEQKRRTRFAEAYMVLAKNLPKIIVNATPLIPIAYGAYAYKYKDLPKHSLFKIPNQTAAFVALGLFLFGMNYTTGQMKGGVF